MIQGLFLKVVNLSLTASWLLAAVLLLRLLFRRVSGRALCVLWLMVGLRLLLPFSLPSSLSLLPSAETIVVTDSETGQLSLSLESGFPELDETFSSENREGSKRGFSAERMLAAAGCIWIGGAVAAMLYLGLSECLLYRGVRKEEVLADNVFSGSRFETAFSLGVISPVIFLPADLEPEDREMVLLHERRHLKRRDPLWKMLGFAVLALHWFNPLVHFAYALFCRDLETACDESLVEDFSESERKSYALALLRCCSRRRIGKLSALSFGEKNVKGRVVRILNFRKSKKWVVILFALSAAIVGLLFMTKPLKTGKRAVQRCVHSALTDEEAVRRLLFRYQGGLYSYRLSEEDEKALSLTLRRVEELPLTEASESALLSCSGIYTIRMSDGCMLRFASEKSEKGICYLQLVPGKGQAEAVCFVFLDKELEEQLLELAEKAVRRCFSIPLSQDNASRAYGTLMSAFGDHFPDNFGGAYLSGSGRLVLCLKEVAGEEEYWQDLLGIGAQELLFRYVTDSWNELEKASAYICEQCEESGYLVSCGIDVTGNCILVRALEDTPENVYRKIVTACMDSGCDYQIQKCSAFEAY